MKYKYNIIFSLILAPSLLLSDNARITLIAIDRETNTPIEHALGYGGFQKLSRGWAGRPPSNVAEGYTDKKGMVQLKETTDRGEVIYYFRKDGFYNSQYGTFRFEKKNSFPIFSVWKPDNPQIEVKLDRIMHPIPLFVVQPHLRQWKKVFGNRRSIDQASTTNTVSASYDLMLGQWLPPFGNGEYADLMVEAKTEPLGIDEYNLPDHKTTRYKTTQKITFTGEGNGIIEMPFDPMAKLHIRIAPTNGYNCTSIIRWKAWQGVKEQYKTSYNENRCFAFRIRTQKDAKGNIVKAYYGKIYGDVNFMEYNAPMGTYYLNTNPNDPNLEYDMKNNLNRNDELEFCILNP